VNEAVEPRELVIEALYEADLREIDDPARGLSGKAARLVRGVCEHRSELDELLDSVSDNWPVYRMPAVDRAVLRLGLYELVHEPDTPKAVVINEAVELAKRFSTQRSGSFVNGVLAALARVVREDA
jgi:N utilization substance protein B